MNYVLIIWEEVPDNLKLYLVPESEATKYKHFLEQAHGKMINTVDWENNQGLQFLNVALMESRSDLSEEDQKFSEHAGIWHQYKYVDSKPIDNKLIVCVYSSGFIM